MGYEPSQKEILEYAEWLGMDAIKDADLLWIAKEGLKAPLPPPWKPCSTGGGDNEGEIFYFNFETGESVWDHPCDEYHRKLLEKERAKKYGLPLDDSADQSASEGKSGSAAASTQSVSLPSKPGEDDGKKKDKKDKKE